MNVEEMIEKVNAELAILHSGVAYESEKARRTASIALMAQFELAKHLSSMHAIAKHAKNELKAKEAEVYLQTIEGKDKKPSDSYLDNKVATSDEVKTAKRTYIEAESEADKFEYIFQTLKDTHILFRGIGNAKELF